MVSLPLSFFVRFSYCSGAQGCNNSVSMFFSTLQEKKWGSSTVPAFLWVAVWMGAGSTVEWNSMPVSPAGTKRSGPSSSDSSSSWTVAPMSILREGSSAGSGGPCSAGIGSCVGASPLFTPAAVGNSCTCCSVPKKSDRSQNASQRRHCHPRRSIFFCCSACRFHSPEPPPALDAEGAAPPRLHVLHAESVVPDNANGRHEIVPRAEGAVQSALSLLPAREWGRRERRERGRGATQKFILSRLFGCLDFLNQVASNRQLVNNQQK